MWAQPKRQSGFTIVELLIVIVVIGILAAITIVAYNGIQQRAHDTSIQSDLTAISKKLALFYVDNDHYPGNTTELEELDLNINPSPYVTSRMLNLSFCATSDRQGYAIGGISTSGKQFFISSNNSVQEYASSLTNDGNREDIASTCADLLPGANRVSGGYYNGSWRPWTGATT